MHLITVIPIILALDPFLDNLHLLNLSLPFRLAHLTLLFEQLGVGPTVGAAQTIPEGRELAVVVVEVQVVHRVASCAVDHGRIGHVLAVVCRACQSLGRRMGWAASNAYGS